MSQSDDREDYYRLREENIRLREEALKASTQAPSPPKDQTINIKQVNEGCFAGCGGMMAIAILFVLFTSKCAG